MDSASPIVLNNVSKVYRLYDKPTDRLKEAVFPFGNNRYHKQFSALSGITFEVGKGETIGIVGKNGSGKSTLLKLITGVLTATSGSIAVAGRISAILELGAGFNQEYTGIENIFLNGTILGYSRDEIENRLDDIIAFADIGDFIYQPVKTYSSGMFSRLAFAVAINVDPDILIVDEALAVGDVKFQTKCFNRFKALKDKGVTILFVGHDIFSVRSFCDKAMWLHEGELLRYGDTLSVTAEYMQFMNQDSQQSSDKHDDLTKNASIEALEAEVEIPFDAINRWGSNIGLIRTGLIRGIKSELSNVLISGERARVTVGFHIPPDIDTSILHIAFSIKNTLGIDVLVSTTYENESFRLERRNGLVEVNFEFDNYLNQGDYILVVALEDRTNPVTEYFDYVEGAQYFKIVTKKKAYGVLNIPVVQYLNANGEK
ncbi:ABC transporter ATP-binding protein [Cohnella faecalis]|uniref:ABC transporter ATP-binding protein n=1 Tax=Cohnella faecalis TaxID=2315694 RepID=A0A398CJ06_9BACL|nr:ABC transporter ATP-binding protein [Cohnella faecalis]RIE02082.1 ABC transporter ATP-binding protein [Cohnella faecalis]